MTATIISFPKKNNNKPKRITKKIRFDVPNILGVPVQKPRTRQEYLVLCKEFMPPEVYKNILCGIMDKEFYNSFDPRTKKVIDCYFSL